MNSKRSRHGLTRTRVLIALLAILFAASTLIHQIYFARRVQAASSTIVISQIYGAGGNSGATLQNDYIELFNKGNSSVNLSGWSVQYASSTGTGNFSSNITNLSGTLAPGQYYLVKEAGGAVGAPLPAADATGTIAMAAGAGKVIVANTTTGLACNGSSTACNASQLAQIVDLVGYGSGTNFFEGTGPTPTINATTAVFRDDFGCTDTDNNAADFAAAAPASPGTPAPRNTASALHPCTANQPIVPMCPSPLTTTQGTATSTAVSATDADGTVTSASIISGSAPGITLDNFVAAGGVGGTATATLNVANTTAAGTYNVTIRYSNDDPTPQTADCTVAVTVNPPNQPIAPSCPGSLNVNQGSAGSANVSATDPDGTVTTASITSPPVPGITLNSFTPAGSVGGAASASLTVANTTAVGTYSVTIQWTNNDSPTPQTASCTVVVNVSAPPDSVVISQVYGGGGNTGSTLKYDYIELINHSSVPVNLDGWSVQAWAFNTSTWQVTPLTNVTLQPGQYYLIQESQGAGGTDNLPTPDAIGTIPISSGSTKVALVSNTTPIAGACPSAVVDLVAYGSDAIIGTCYEGSGAAPQLSNTIAALRRNEGCFDTDDNAGDFITGAPNPRNTSSPAHDCTGLSAYGSANPSTVVQGDSSTLTVHVAIAQNPSSTGVTVTADLTSIGGSASQTFAGSGSVFTYTATVPANNPPGMKSLPVTVSDGEGRTANTNILLSILPIIPDHVTISQVYGGGGNTGATYANDYVELYNPTAATISMTGWSIQYGPATGTTFTGKTVIGGTIAPGAHYLISLASGGAVGAPVPPASVNGDINMAAGAGKVALVSNTQTLIGTCPVGADADIVDFVGYGTTANCHEGNANAPAPGNTIAIFRKNSGGTDTDQNGNDFVTGAPNPRSESPVVEFGPSVANTDPATNSITAPYDLTVTVDFSEPVNVDSGWYNITCTNTGAHNLATEAHTNNLKTYAFTPNTTFQFGEQCTVTITKTAVHDVDTDDSEPGTDTLAADYVWSFTVVSAGQAAPYPPSVHLTMGNPSGADVFQPLNYLMEKPTYSLSYNRDKGTPNWVSWHLDSSWYGTLTRVDTFRPDPAIDPTWYRVQAFDYSGSGFDRGHMTPNADRDNQNRVPINQETYLMTNMVPQSPDNNQGPWAALEGYLRTQTDAGNEIYIVSGPAGVGGTGSVGFSTTIANGHVTVPEKTWKVALVLPQGTNDISRVSCSTRTIAVILPNIQGIRNDDWQNYLTTVDAVETLTGYNLFSNLPPAVQACVEAGTNGTNPPGTADQSASTAEETPVTITLQGLQSNDSALTFSIVSGPTSGSLGSIGPVSCLNGTCSADVSYTPGANFFGSDSFTFRASNGTSFSNTSTVSITVSNVEDAPDAVDDTPTVVEDSGANVINVLSNDTDADNDTLTVTAVTQGTNGSVTNNGTSVSYSPNANFFGNDSFTYTISDGNGGSDTATVNVTVMNVNDAPVANNDNYVTNSNTTLNVATPGVLSNDSDIDGPSLSSMYVAASGPSHGVLTLNGDGSFTYSPNLDYTGSDSFSYQAFDGSAYSNVATVMITVNDTVAPTLNSTLAINLLTSTNSDLINVGLNASATDNSGTPVQIQVAVFGDENDETPTKQNVLHSPDAKDIGPNNTLRLRAERVEANDGRVYLIVVTATDTSGNVSRSYHTVVVPKSSKQSNIDSVNTQAAAAVSYAQTHNGAPPLGYFVIGDGPIIGPKQ